MNKSSEEQKRQVESVLNERARIFQTLEGRLPSHPLETEWSIDGDDVLTSIYRSSDLSRRGVRGLIAEYFFDREVIPQIVREGWNVVPIPIGDFPYDSLVKKGDSQVSIQIKLQRLTAGQPKRFWANKYEEVFYDVEVQKTRTGKKRQSKSGIVESETPKVVPELTNTRPYPFGAFDILAVNMQPATKNWSEFRFTVAKWLLPRADSPSLIEIHQPVSLVPDDAWTNDLSTCLEWYLSGRQNKVLKDIKHSLRFRREGKP
ncbi:MAG: hypothetical protein WAM85_00240 [Terracidiphilus sp.]